MCTVTFIPRANNDFVLTSNRDEAPGRNTLPPRNYNEDGLKLLYPKDEVAGGTWIGVSGKKRIVTLMNGGFVSHQRKSFYRKSRGLVVKDLLKFNNLIDEIRNYDYNDIEPFTAILIEWEAEVRLFQLVWDGTDYHFSEEPLTPRIWSSSPLYPENLKKRRELWFSNFLFKSLKPSKDEILEFHKTAGEGDSNDNLIMDRGHVKTKSITQIIRKGELIEMHYEDLHTGVVQSLGFN